MLQQPRSGRGWRDIEMAARGAWLPPGVAGSVTPRQFLTARRTRDAGARPRLARRVRLSFCRTRQRHILQLPETVVVLHGSGADILDLCDGRRTVAEIVAELGTRYRTVPDEEVRRFLTRLVARRCVTVADD